MTAILTMFDGVALPEYDTRVPAGTGPTVSTTTGTAGGGYFDAQGTKRGALKLPYELPFRGTLAESSVAALTARLKTLKGLRGKVGRLCREMGDGSTQWCEAKCMEVPAPREAGQGTAQQVEMTFEVRSPWFGALHGEAWYVGESGIYLGDGHVLGYEEIHQLETSPKTITVHNGGDGQVKAIRVTVTAGDQPVTALTLACGDCEWTWTGTLAATKDLVVDAGAWTVTNDGADAWNGLQVTANHKRGEWLILEPGDNVITVTTTSAWVSGAPNIRFDFYEVHE